jgi:hypothetical protein
LQNIEKKIWTTLFKEELREQLRVARKERNKIVGQFVPLAHNLLKSKAYMDLSTGAKVALNYFLMDKKSGHQTELILTFPQAKNYGVCSSPTTFNKIKKELVAKGFLDSSEPGGLGKHSVYKESYRWKYFGTDQFEELQYRPGFGSKYFQTI